VPDWLSLFLTVIGTIGLTTVVNLVVRSRELTLARRYFRLNSKAPTSVVLVTSGYEDGGIAGAIHKRHVVSLATLQASAMFAEMLGTFHYGQGLKLTISEGLRSAPRGDLALLGGPVKNKLAAHFLSAFNAANPELRIDREIKDDKRILRIGAWSETFTPQLQADGTPANDLALLIVWKNPFAREQRRAVLCAGFTSWGTAAAAEYYCTDFFRFRYKQLRREHELPRARSKKWPIFVTALEVRMTGDAIVSTKERFFAVVPSDPQHVMKSKPVEKPELPSLQRSAQ
jgi:hypothetical protein